MTENSEQNEFLADLTRNLKITTSGMYGEYLDDLERELIETSQRHRREFDQVEALVNLIIDDEIKNGH
jgi:hypothetical protein